ncbi:WD repeat-containing protein 75 [Tanacetum coccineum]
MRGWISNRGSQWNEKLSQRARWACHAVGSYRKKPMTTAAFSADGSVLAVAAETFITLWDPEKNVLLAVIGSAHEVGPLVMLCCFESKGNITAYIDCKSFIYRRVQLSCICVLRFKSTTLSMEFTGHTSLTQKVSAIRAITSAQQKLQLYSEVPPNGLELSELLESELKYGFIVMVDNKALFGILSGNRKQVLDEITVDPPDTEVEQIMNMIFLYISFAKTI